MVAQDGQTTRGRYYVEALDPGRVREVAVRHPFERFTPTTITDVDELLAELTVIGAQGYALSNEEWEPGLRSVAAPVHSREGHVVAAVCVIVVRAGVTTRS